MNNQHFHLSPSPDVECLPTDGCERLTTPGKIRCRVGLTGPLGAGKSLVAKVWTERGAGVVEGDEMGHLVLESDPELRHRLIERFGNGMWLILPHLRGFSCLSGFLLPPVV